MKVVPVKEFKIHKVEFEGLVLEQVIVPLTKKKKKTLKAMPSKAVHVTTFPHAVIFGQHTEEKDESLK